MNRMSCDGSEGRKVGVSSCFSCAMYTARGDSRQPTRIPLREALEAFVDLRGSRGSGTYRDLGVDIKAKVLKWTGVPVTVGIAATKTLAKVANYLAKTSMRAAGVLDLTDSR